MLKAIVKAKAYLNSLRAEEEGATAVEYALIIGLVSLLVIGALALLVEPITDFINNDIISKL